MTAPRWIDLDSIADVPSTAEIAGLACDGHHVVLRFAQLEPPALIALVAALATALTEHSVFTSGPTAVTVTPVVSRQRIEERAHEIRAAIADFKHMSATLSAHYRAETLSTEWEANEHGDHVRLYNTATGQVVEAAMSSARSDVDPFFFALFVRSTPAHARVAELLNSDFYDAARILDHLADRESAMIVTDH